MKVLLAIGFQIVTLFAFTQDYYNVDSKTFFESGLANDTAQLENLNNELLQAAIFHSTNLERSKKRQFKYDKHLEKAATFHSTEMLEKNFFSHTNRKNKKYKSPALRAKKFNAKFAIIGENIIEKIALDYNNKSLYDADKIGDKYFFTHHNNGEKIRELTYKELADKIVNAWMHSPGHKANILNKEYTHLGVGVSILENVYNNEQLPVILATQLFGG